MTVIDTSAFVAFVLREEKWESIEGVLHENPTSVELLPVEAANAILTALRHKRLDEAEAGEALQAVEDLSEVAVTLVPSTPLLREAWEIANDNNVSVYDSVFIALARSERTSLASRDRDQLRAAKNVGVRGFEV